MGENKRVPKSPDYVYLNHEEYPLASPIDLEIPYYVNTVEETIEIIKKTGNNPSLISLTECHI